MLKIGKLEEKYLLQVPDLIKQYRDDYNGEFGTLETNVEGMIKQLRASQRRQSISFCAGG